MSKLNEYNDKTKKKIHLMVTSLCNRKCKYCCNNQYDLNDIPYVTHEELKEADVLYLTGGEPFAFTNPCSIAVYYKTHYPNIKKVFVYTNAAELWMWLKDYEYIYGIDGVTVSIKTESDRVAFNALIYNDSIQNRTSNMLYVFDNLYPQKFGNFKVKERVWQEDFVPEPNSIFRKI